MLSIRNIVCFMIIITATWLSQSHVMEHHWGSAIFYLLLGLGLALVVFIWFTSDIVIPWFNELALAMLLLLGIFTMFLEHRGFDPEVQSAHFDALQAFVQLDARNCFVYKEVIQLQKEGAMACGLQNYTDQMNAINELQKARYLDPFSSLIDGVRSAVVEDNKDWCAEVFQNTYKVCPKAFIFMKEESRRVLLDE